MLSIYYFVFVIVYQYEKVSCFENFIRVAGENSDKHYGPVWVNISNMQVSRKCGYIYKYIAYIIQGILYACNIPHRSLDGQVLTSHRIFHQFLSYNIFPNKINPEKRWLAPAFLKSKNRVSLANEILGFMQYKLCTVMYAYHSTSKQSTL